jgi:uncharacterized membrane protein
MKRAIRRNLIAGLVVIAPLTATIVVLWWIFDALDGLLGRFLYPALGGFVGRETLVVPGLGLIVLFLILLSIGWAAQRAIGTRAVRWWNDLLERLPLTSRIYGAANRFIRTVFSEEARPFKTAVLVEYPSAGKWAVGFISADPPAEVNLALGDDVVTVFIPKTPNIATGMLAIVPRASVTQLAMSVEEAFTYVLSAGAVRPDIAGERSVAP